MPIIEVDGGKYYFREANDGPVRYGPYASHQAARDARDEHMAARQTFLAEQARAAASAEGRETVQRQSPLRSLKVRLFGPRG